MTTFLFVFYNLLLLLLIPLFLLAAAVNRKIRALFLGQFSPLPQTEAMQEKEIIWLHAASGGEFQQILPLQRTLQSPQRYLLLTVTSPSVYLKVRHHKGFDHVRYVPWEFPCLIRRFIRRVQPRVMINTRHDIWPNLYRILKKKRVPTLLINANLYRSSARLKGVSRKLNAVIFNQIGEIATVNQATADLLRRIYNGPLYVWGDTRFDQIVFRAAHPDFSSERLKDVSWFIFGSLLSGENELVLKAVAAHPDKPFIIVPHETGRAEISWWERAVSGLNRPFVLRSKLETLTDENIIIWDSVGELADLYGYGIAAYVGGGFGAGVHSVIEPVVYHIPVAYGPKYDILAEAIELAENGTATVIRSPDDLTRFIEQAFDPQWNHQKTELLRRFVHTRSGATEKSMQHLDTLLRRNKITTGPIQKNE